MTSSSVIEQPVDEVLQARFGVDRAGIVALCQRFRIVELGLFGSALRDDFRDGGDDPSDVDLLVVFDSGCSGSYQAYFDCEKRLKGCLGGRWIFVRSNCSIILTVEQKSYDRRG